MNQTVQLPSVSGGDKLASSLGGPRAAPRTLRQRDTQHLSRDRSISIYTFCNCYQTILYAPRCTIMLIHIYKYSSTLLPYCLLCSMCTLSIDRSILYRYISALLPYCFVLHGAFLLFAYYFTFYVRWQSWCIFPVPMESFELN